MNKTQFKTLMRQVKKKFRSEDDNNVCGIPFTCNAVNMIYDKMFNGSDHSESQLTSDYREFVRDVTGFSTIHYDQAGTSAELMVLRRFILDSFEIEILSTGHGLK